MVSMNLLYKTSEDSMQFIYRTLYQFYTLFGVGCDEKKMCMV